ncbi:MAG: C4-dicarboxylate ABC transporter substrate-binding protein, partial [Synergistaceae bacterium]|nr:C4-dicarboxylate ABC transporter substrate-binding protein [Synergistaceae bacterium]
VYLVSFDDEHILKLIADSPYYSKNVIAKEVYGTDEDVTTVAVGAVVIARDDVREADVYNFLYGIFENKDAIAAAHAKGNDLDLNFAVSYTAVPYHPGAIKYFAEKGLNVTGK